MADRHKKCPACDRIYYAVSMDVAAQQVIRFNQAFNALSVEDRQKCFGGKRVSIRSYMFCACGERNTTMVTIPYQDTGKTLNPIIDEDL